MNKEKSEEKKEEKPKEKKKEAPKKEKPEEKSKEKQKEVSKEEKPETKPVEKPIEKSEEKPAPTPKEDRGPDQSVGKEKTETKSVEKPEEKKEEKKSEKEEPFSAKATEGKEEKKEEPKKEKKEAPASTEGEVKAPASPASGQATDRVGKKIKKPTEEKPEKKAEGIAIRIRKYLKNLMLGVSLQEKVFFARHLSIIIKAGMPLLDALNMLKKQTESKAMAKILDQVVKDVSEGQFLSTSLEKYHSIFGSLFINIIRVGEASGILPENLDYLSQELKKKQEMRKKVIGALIYPFVIMIATFGIVGMMMIFVLPKIFPVFTSLNVELPITTKILVAITNAFANYTGTAVLVFLGFIVVIWLLMRIQKVKFYNNWLLLHTPLIGKMMTSVNMANFSRTLGLLLKSGVKIVEATNITADTLGNLVYRKELKGIANSIQKGELISQHLTTRKSLFPKMATNMIAVGENTGNLSETLLYLSEFYESEVNELTKNLSNTLEPFLMIIMGIIVGFVAISIIMPIYSITQQFGQ